jgi:hypothetical protein
MESKNKYRKHKKIVINTAEDLLKIPQEDFEKINISNLCGNYFNQIYQEALEKEQKNINIEDLKSLDSREYQSDSKTFKSNAKTNFESPIRNEKNLIHGKKMKTSPTKNKNRIYSKGKNKVKKKHNYKIFVSQFTEDENDNSSVSDNKIFSPDFNSKLNTFEFNNDISSSDMSLNRVQNDFEPVNTHKKIESNLSSVFDEIKNNERKQVYLSMFEKACNDGNNPIYNNKIKSDEIINLKRSKSKSKSKNKSKNKSKSQNKKYRKNHKTFKIKSVSEYKINKIYFYIKYDSKYGDNIGILGSIEELGNWCQDKILYLKWNKGNIWTGDVELSSDIEKFEFKFINRHDGVIFWERGLNNVVDLKGLIQELKFQKKGRYNKYEYNYNSDVDEITLTCKIKGWE